MDAEITDKNGAGPAGWVYFDAECRFCITHRRRWGSVFERRGFVWIPLQTSGCAQRLGITEAQLRAEMWLQLADGRKLSGINAWCTLLRWVWWLWPAGALLSVPGINAVGRALYRWIARRRHCIGGACVISNRAQPGSLNRRGTL